MATRISLYDRTGQYLTDIVGRCTRSWVLNAIGVAKITLEANDHTNIKTIYPGNLVLIENSRAGAWGGLIWPKFSFLSGSFQITAYSAEYLLRQRRVRSGVTTISGTAGQMFSALIAMANEQEDTRITLGNADSTSLGWSETLKYQTIYDMIVKLHEKSGEDWSITPSVDTGGRLQFVANWHTRRGTDSNYRLEEGVNIERPSGSGLDIDGDISNDVLVYGNSSSVTSVLQSNKIDEVSRGLYGLRQSSFGVDSTVAAGLDAAATAKLAELAYPTANHKLVILDQPSAFPAFNYIDLGNTVVYNAVHYGFGNSDGSVGQGDTRIRITHREYDEAIGKMPVTVYEV